MNMGVLSAGDKYSGRAKRTDAAATDADASQVRGLAAPSFKYRRRPLSNLSVPSVTPCRTPAVKPPTLSPTTADILNAQGR
jgi:hypothetical protein